jgi:transcription-repair coupling factor (superfamily II helicase)
MNFSNILKDYLPYKSIISGYSRTPISVEGVTESAQPQLIYSLAENNGSSALIITYTDIEARTVRDELKLYFKNTVTFPSKDYIFYNIETTGHQSENERLDVIAKLSEGNTIVTASVDALMQYTLPKDIFTRGCIDFEIGKVFDIDSLAQKLLDIGYSREEMVEGEGQFAIRGGILDVYSPNYPNPLRIEFFDNETDSIREFDSYTQRSLDKLSNARIIPVSEMLFSAKRRNEIAAELQSRLKAEK